MSEPAPTRNLARDVWWNVGSLAIGGAVGILLNYLISVVYGASTLGVFNQVFAVYLLFSQLAALGCHYSVLKHIAATDAAAERRAITTAGVVSALCIGTLFALLALVLAGPIGDMVDSPEVTRGIRYIAPGILFFALSKMTLAALNGLRRMRWYAILYGGRFVLMMVAFSACWALDADGAVLPVILTASEVVIFLASLVPLRGLVGPVPRAELRRWIDEHVRFGLRGFMSGMLAELNTRVDILILGIFTPDAVVGAFSFASILAEGMYQLLIVLRTNFAPLVIRLWAEGKKDELAAMVRRNRDRTYLGALALGVVAVAGYTLVVPAITTDPALAESWKYFAVLVAGMVATAGYSPFLPILLYCGHPGWYSLLMLVIVVANAVANVTLVALFGAIGAAIGTATAYVVGVVALRAMTARLLGLRI